jgi:hypothetical protein
MPNPKGIGGFKPGQSGNPGGRPRAVAMVRHELSRHIGEANARLMKLMRRGHKDDAVKLGALKEFYDRTLGRPVQAVDIRALMMGEIDKLTPEQLKVVVEQYEEAERLEQATAPVQLPLTIEDGNRG